MTKFIETLRVDNGNFCNLERHTRRAFDTAGIHLPDIEIPDSYKSERVKCRIVYSQSGVEEITFSIYNLPTINSLQMVVANDIVYDKKYEDRLAINTLFSLRGGCDDILIVKNGYVCDTSFCNVVFACESKLFTPHTTLLSGTKRSKLIDANVITPTEIRIADIQKYDTIHLINAMIDLSDNVSMPINRIILP